MRHAATPGFARIGWNNGLAPNAAGHPQGDTAATVQGSLPQPSAEGTYHWNIPVRYRCFNSTWNGRIFTRKRQRFTMENDGTMTVTKGGARVERTLDAIGCRDRERRFVSAVRTVPSLPDR